MPTYRDPAAFPNALLIEACDIPAEMTIAEWRRHRRPSHPTPLRRRLRFSMRRTREV
jgi:hypothetical protein